MSRFSEGPAQIAITVFAVAMSKELLQNTGLKKRQPSRAHNKGRS